MVTQDEARMRRRANSRALGLCALTLAFGLSLAGLGAAWQARHNAAQAAERFDALVRRVVAQVTTRMHLYEYGLRGLRGAVVAAGGATVRREQLDAYGATRDVDREFPGARGYGVILRVPESDERAFVAAARRGGWPDFDVHQLAPHAGERAVIEYIEPLERNRQALGLDVASEPTRRAAAQAAMRSGAATLTAPITLVQASGKPSQAFLLMLPIYRPGAPLADAAQREAAAIGWSYAPLVIDDALRDTDLFDSEMSLTLRDLDDPARHAFFQSAPGDPPAATGLEQRIVLPVFGRRWEAGLRATPAFLQALGQPAPASVGAVLAAGSLLVAAVAWLLAQRRFRQQAGRLEQARRAAIVDASEDAIVGQTLDGVVTEWNAGAQRLFGYPAEAALGRTVASILLPPGREHEDAEIRAAIARGERVAAFDTTRRHADGHEIDVSVTAAPILDAAGRCVGFAKTLRDIRETQRTRRALAELNASLEQQVAERSARLTEASRFVRDLTDRLPLRVAYVDAELRYRFVNQAHCRRFGLPREQILGRTCAELTAAPNAAETLEAAQAALRGESRAYEFEERQDGEAVTFEGRLVPDRDPDGRVVGFFALGADITSRMRAEAELRRALTLLRAVLDASTQVSIIAVGSDGLVSVFNRGAEQLLGHAAGEVVGREPAIRFHDPDELRSRAAALSAKLGREVPPSAILVEPEALDELHEWTYRRKDGSPVPVSLAVTEMRDDRGELVGHLGIAYDISERKGHERSLHEAMARANNANAAKSQFLANMSHEIRTPMNAVIGLTYLLERTRLDDEQAGFVNQVKLAGQALLSLINDVLDLSKIEASEMRIERAPFLVRDLVSQFPVLFGMQAEAKGIAFSIEMSPRLPDGLVGDVTRLRQVLTNLLGNAIKFTERGSVGLAIELASVAGGKARVRFIVRDTGIGIPAEALERLFLPFVQADDSTTRRFGGTGLGLSIVKQIVELMGGEVEVRSESGAGSEFRFELEFPVVDAQPFVPARARSAAAAQEGAGLSGIRVLVVDDVAVNLKVAQRLLQSEGATVFLATNGQEALDHLGALTEPVDIVLMDVQMPVLDGHQATRRIRDELGLARLPVVALTAGVTTGERQRAEAAGMNDVLGKPIDPTALAACIRRHLKLAGADAIVAPALSPAAAAEWPEIDGIDGADARMRLVGNVGLFRSLLKRLLEDLAEVGEPVSVDEAALHGLAARMHRLKSGAGTLGAKAVEACAADIEEACRAQDPARATRLLLRLSIEIARLRANAAAFLRGADPPPAPGEPGPADEASARAVGELRDLLERRDLGAIDRFAELAHDLRKRFGAQACATLREQIDNLLFADAAKGLAQLGKPGPG